MTDTTDMTETTSQYVHKTVLLHESIDGLGIMPGDTYLDGTLGSAGHAAETARKGTPEHPITIVGIDQDTEALARSQERLDKVVSTTGHEGFLGKRKLPQSRQGPSRILHRRAISQLPKQTASCWTWDFHRTSLKRRAEAFHFSEMNRSS